MIEHQRSTVEDFRVLPWWNEELLDWWYSRYLALAISAKYVVFAGMGHIEIWKSATGEHIRSHEYATGDYPLCGLSLHNSAIVYADAFGVRRLDIDSGALLSEALYEGRAEQITNIAIGRNSGLYSHNHMPVRSCDAITGKALGPPLLGTESAIEVTTLAVGDIGATGNEAGEITIWDLNTAQRIETLRGHNDQINALLTFQGVIVSASNDHTVRVWDWRALPIGYADPSDTGERSGFWSGNEPNVHRELEDSNEAEVRFREVPSGSRATLERLPAALVARALYGSPA